MLEEDNCCNCECACTMKGWEVGGRSKKKEKETKVWAALGELEVRHLERLLEILCRRYLSYPISPSITEKQTCVTFSSRCLL